MRSSLLALLALVFFAPGGAFAADCTGPGGPEGQVIYNEDSHVPQVCIDGMWVAMGQIDPAAGGPGCTGPDAPEGQIIYNQDHHVLQYCDGDDWQVVAGGVGCGTGSGGGGGASYPVELELVNAAFESGDMTGWTVVAGNQNVISGSLPGYDYRCVLSTNTSTAEFYQDAVLPPSVITDVDAGLVYVWYTMWQDDWSGDNDSARPAVSFVAENEFVSAKTVHPSIWWANGTWRERMVVEPVPAGARKVRIEAQGSRASGTELSAYVTALSARLIKPLEPFALINGDFQSGDLTGWTTAAGAPQILGSYYLHSGDQSSMEIYQDVAIPAELAALLAAGDLGAFVRYRLNGWDGDSDRGFVTLDFYDSGDGLLASVSAAAVSVFGTWIHQAVIGAVPASTSYVRVRVRGTRVQGTNLDAYFDDLEMYGFQAAK